MQRLAGIVFLVVLCDSIALGQVASVPEIWTGTWALNTQESGASNGELLEMASTSGHLKIASSSITAKGGPWRLELDLNLDGTETVSPEGARLSLRPVDDLTFDVILSVNSKTFGNQVEKIHFVLSADGNSLRQTRTRTEREVVVEGADPALGKLIRTSTSSLVFVKILFIPPAGRVFLRPAKG